MRTKVVRKAAMKAEEYQILKKGMRMERILGGSFWHQQCREPNLMDCLE